MELIPRRQLHWAELFLPLLAACLTLHEGHLGKWPGALPHVSMFGHLPKALNLHTFRAAPLY
jgi:hypothetical protein